MNTRARREKQADQLLREALDSKGQRFTEQRAAVYRYLRGNTEHPTADDIFAAVRPRLPDISLATVYKTLETLVGCGLAAKLSFGDGSARFDPRAEEHGHARCLGCGTVRDVSGSDLPATLDFEIEEGFEVHGVRLEVVGYCRGCQKN